MTEYTGIAVKEYTCTAGGIGSDISQGPDFPDYSFHDYIQMDTRKRVFWKVSPTHHSRTGSHRIDKIQTPQLRKQN